MNFPELTRDKLRAESGPCKFGDDWTGVFIRGDEAMEHARRLSKLDQLPETARRIVIDDLVELLMSCDEGELVEK